MSGRKDPSVTDKSSTALCGIAAPKLNPQINHPGEFVGFRLHTTNYSADWPIGDSALYSLACKCHVKLQLNQLILIGNAYFR
jgi:hypothetical protein